MDHHAAHGSEDIGQARINEADAVERGRWLFAQDCTFVIGAAHIDQVPESELCEVAFAGRSNVGKSSLINTLTNRKTLARTSNTPGRTQQINFFVVGGILMLADLPGFGYAKAPRGEVERWGRLAKAYLKGRAQLRKTCLLVDSRHGIKKNDRLVMAMLDASAQPYQVVLTKCDKITQTGLSDITGEISDELAAHPAAHPNVIATSTRDCTGIAELRAALAILV